MKGDKGKHYTEDEQKAALELAAAIGPTAAGRQLDINRATIYKWAQVHAKLWSDLRAGDPTVQRRNFAIRLEDLADRYGATENDLLDQIDAGRHAPKDAKEAAALLKAMSSGRMAAVAGARQMSGEPETVEHTINFPALEQAMERLLGQGGPAPVIEGTVRDVDAALPSGD